MSETTLHDDVKWLTELSEGNPDAFRNIYTTYQKSLFTFAFYLTKSKEISDEVLQEVFIKLWEKRTQFQPDIQLLPYLKKMTQNQVLDTYRKANRDKSLKQQLYTALVQASEKTSDALWEKELSRVFTEAIRQLPPQQKLVYSLHRNENLSYQEIADKLGLSRHTIQNHLAAATKSVRQYVENNTDLACLILAIWVTRNGN